MSVEVCELSSVGVWGMSSHNHPSLAVNFPKNMKMEGGKKLKERNARKMEEEGPGDEAREIEKEILLRYLGE